MKCDTALGAVDRLMDAELGPFAAWRVRRHTASCADCAKELSSLRRVDQLVLAADLVPSISVRGASNPDSGAPVRRIKRAVIGSAVAAGGLAVTVAIISLLPGMPASPTVAFADVERAMKSVRTASWIETWSMWRDGKEEWAIVTEHWARLNPPAYATRDLPERRRGHVSTPHDKSLFDEKGTTQFNQRAGKYTVVRMNTPPGPQLRKQVQQLILSQISAPKLGKELTHP